MITSGVTPSVHVDYKHSRIKQYFKLGHAIRTETTINDSTDFGVGRRLHNLASLARIGFNANRRLLDAQANQLRHPQGLRRLCPGLPAHRRRRPAHAGDALRPSRHPGAARALVIFRTNPAGFSNRELRDLLAPMLGTDPASMTPGQMTYQLRRLRLHGLIERTPCTFRYRVTDLGLRSALVLTRAHNRFLTTVMADVSDTGPPSRSPLGRALDAVATEIDLVAARSRLAA